MLKILRWGNYPELSGWAHFHYMNPYKRQMRGLESKKKSDMMTEAERRIVRCYAAGFQEMEGVVQAKDASSLLKI